MTTKANRYGKMGDAYMDGTLTESLAGPLIGGGTTQIGTLAAKLIWKDQAAIQKWAPSIGLGLGAIVSGILAFRPATRGIGIAGLVTAALVAIPRQLEELMMGDEAATAGWDGLGIITAETEMQGLGAEGAEQAVELLGDGSGSLGVVVPEMGGGGQMGAGGAEDAVQLLGNGGFGANFLQ